MAEGDDELDPTARDRDRAAILARRQHFIALALTGLATTVTACDTKSPSPPNTGGNSGPASAPQPCLDVAVPEREEEGEAGEAGEQAEVSGGNPPPPQVCLKFSEPEPEPEPEAGSEPSLPEPDAKPRVCLKKAAPHDPDEIPPPAKPKPQPCLRKATP